MVPPTQRDALGAATAAVLVVLAVVAVDLTVKFGAIHVVVEFILVNDGSCGSENEAGATCAGCTRLACASRRKYNDLR